MGPLSENYNVSDMSLSVSTYFVGARRGGADGMEEQNVEMVQLRCGLGELLMENDWMEKNYLQPFEGIDATSDTVRSEAQCDLYNSKREEINIRLGRMRELVSAMRNCLDVIERRMP